MLQNTHYKDAALAWGKAQGEVVTHQAVERLAAFGYRCLNVKGTLTRVCVYTGTCSTVLDTRRTLHDPLMARAAFGSIRPKVADYVFVRTSPYERPRLPLPSGKGNYRRLTGTD